MMEFITAHPFATAGIAFAVGLLVGVFIEKIRAGNAMDRTFRGRF